jgi:hypothetical protein
VGVGETADAGNPASYFGPDVVRAALAIPSTPFSAAPPTTAWS